MSTITDALNEVEPIRTAGALPSSRTNDMVEDALSSDDIDQVKAELTHSRAHYQSLEFLLNDEATILATLQDSIEVGEYPTPTTPAEALELAVRIYSKVVIEVAYDNAHRIGIFMAMGMSVQEALQTLYSNLDHTDPERTVTDEALVEFLSVGDDD